MFFANSYYIRYFYHFFVHDEIRVLESIFRRFHFGIEQRVTVRSKQKFKAENSLGRFKFIIWKRQHRNLLFKNTFETFVGSKYSPENTSVQFKITFHIHLFLKAVDHCSAICYCCFKHTIVVARCLLQKRLIVASRLESLLTTVFTALIEAIILMIKICS